MTSRPPRPRRCLAPALAVALLPAARSRGDDPPPVPSDPVFQALRTDGTTARGRIRQIGPEGRAVLVDGSSDVVVPFSSLVKLTREGDPPPARPDGPCVVFPGGDRLRALIGATGETTLEVTPPLLGDAPLLVPLDAPLALVLAPPSDPSAQEATFARASAEARDSEVLWLANGDRVAGGFLGLSAESVSFQRDGADAPSELGRTGVVAVGFDPKVASYPAPKGPHLELTFLDGSRLGVTDARLDGGKIAAKTRFGAAIRAPLGDLAEARVLGGSVEYLSARDEARAVYVGYLAPHRESYGRDLSADGRVLKLGGRPYDRGLGTQPRTLLAYQIGPRDRRFQATVGLDDRAGPLASVVFRVLVDGKERAATPTMTARDAPRALDVDLSGARTLILATEFGDRGDVQDLAAWADARLVRSEE